MDTETIILVVFFLAVLILLVIAEIRKTRFLLRFGLICIVSFSPIMVVVCTVSYSSTINSFNSALFIIRNSISDNNVQFVRDTFRDFDFTHGKRMWELYETLRLSSNVPSASHGMPRDEAWSFEKEATLKKDVP